MKPTHPLLPRAPRRQAQRGLTLIEWMISIALGTFLLVALLALIAQQSATQAELDRSSRQIENGRYAMELLATDIQLAGYYGEFGAVSAVTVPTLMPAPCSASAADLTAAIPFAVQGYDLSLTGSTVPTDFSTCPANTLVAANHQDGTDILVVRHAEPEVATGTALTVNQTYLQAGLTTTLQEFGYVIAPASGTDVSSQTATYNLRKKDGSVAALRKYLVHIYYISPCNVPTTGSTCSSAGTDDGGTSVPTLKRLELSVVGGAAVFKVTPLVEGIERMQIDYGVDSDDDGIPDGNFLTTPATLGDWANVMAMRVHLLARNNERSAGHDDSANSYSLGLAGSVTPAAGDRFKRRVFSQLIRLVNPSGRRDK